MQSYRRKCRKFRFVNSVPAEQGARTAAGVFAPDGRRVFRWDSAGSCALRSAGTCRAPRRGKRVDTKVSTLLTPTSFYFLVWRRLPTCDRSEKEYGRGFFLCCGRTTFGVRPLEQHVRSVRYCSATHVVSSTQARHTRAAQLFNALYRMAPTNLGIWYNLSSQVLSIITRLRLARHCYVAPA